MLTAVVLAGGLVIGASPSRMVLAWAAWQRPEVAAVALAALVIGLRIMGPADTRSEEAIFLRTVAAELRAGQALRMAVVEAAGRVSIDLRRVIRHALAGRPMSEVANALQGELAAGRSVAVAVEVASVTGGRVSEVFDRLAVLAAESDEMRRERKALAAQARLSALIVGGFPLIYLLWLLSSGTWSRLSSGDPTALAVLLLGVLLLGAGVVVVAVMLARVKN